MKKHKRKKVFSRVFKRGLKIYLIALSLIIIGVLTYVWFALRGYQNRFETEQAADSSYSAMEAQMTFEAALDAMTTSDWVKAWETTYPDIPNSENAISSYIDSIYSTDSVSKFKAEDYTDTEPRYLVRINDADFARFDMLRDTEGNWAVDNITMLASGQSAITFAIPEGCSASYGGCTIDSSLGIVDSDTIVIDGYDEQLVNPVIYMSYSLNGLLEEAEVTVTSDRDECPVGCDSDGLFYYVAETDESEAIRSRAENFIRKLLYYYQMGKEGTSENMNAASACVASGSDAAKTINQSYDGVIWRKAYPEYSYTIECSDVFILADNAMCVDISYTEASSDEAGTYRVYLIDLGEGYKIYSFEMK